MKWENLSADEFEAAVASTGGVCILGVLEYHGAHLPLGTDMLRAHRMACDVAEVEPAIVFPVVPFGSNFEAKLYPGSVMTENGLLFSLLENICDEISRNGLHKILLLSGHGGNKWLLPQFALSLLDPGGGMRFVAFVQKKAGALK
jgi:creatinine amidohydrolase